jgi:hypothetical protein
MSIPTDVEEKRIADLGLPGESYDWPEVFKYASGAGEGGTPVAVPEGSDLSATAFDTADVERVEKAVEGDNDGPDWVAFGLLKDGRWFCVSAGCDYTGWG